MSREEEPSAQSHGLGGWWFSSRHGLQILFLVSMLASVVGAVELGTMRGENIKFELSYNSGHVL